MKRTILVLSLVLAAAGGGWRVVDLCTITGGTGDWAGVTGHIRIHGTFTFAEGGNSHYEGVISPPFSGTPKPLPV